MANHTRPAASGGSYGSQEELVAALRAGDDQAFECIVRDHGGRMLQVARRYLPEEDARDAVQEAFLSAFQAIERFEGRARLDTWLHRIVVNASLMRLRRSDQQQEPIDAHLPSFGENGKRVDVGPAWPVTAADFSRRAELRDALRRSLAKVPDAYRAVFLLRDIEGANTDEAAEALGITPNAVRIRLHRARQALREQLDKHLRGTQP